MNGGRVAGELKALLRQVPFFADLADEQLDQLAEVGRFRSLGAGETVFRAGDPGDTLYVILSGSVRVFQPLEAGEDAPMVREVGDSFAILPGGSVRVLPSDEDDQEEVELVCIGPGHSFGEMSIIDGGPRSASVKTLEPSEFFLIDREPCLELLTHSPEMIAETLAALARKVRDKDAKVFGLIREIERRRSQAEIERHRSIAQMVAGVAHEINTPLGIINQAASVIDDELTTDRLQRLAQGDRQAEAVLGDITEAARLILASASRARELIVSFKNLSVRQITDTREKVDLGRLVAEVAGLYRFQARASKLQIDLEDELGDDPDRRAWEGYPGYLSQILLNLISNADRDAYPEGQGGRVEIVIRAATAPGNSRMPRYELVVADFGCGIAQADLTHIFNPFFTTGRARGGTGLGLSIVHNLVTTALEGSIDVASAPGQGTRFTIRVPCVLKGTAANGQTAGGPQGDAT